MVKTLKKGDVVWILYSVPERYEVLDADNARFIATLKSGNGGIIFCVDYGRMHRTKRKCLQRRIRNG